MSEHLNIRLMQKSDLKWALEMARQEGWNPGLADASAFFAADQNSFFVGEIDAEPVNVISAVRYGEAFGFIGLYICRPEKRGKGYGHKIWDHAMNHLRNRVIGLDAVKEQTTSYAEHGFKPVYRNVRYAGLAVGNAPTDPRLRRLGPGIFPGLLDFDRRFFPANRSDFLKHWTDPGETTRRGLVFLDDEKVKGYGVIRQCHDGYKIGPLFADEPTIAEILFCALSGSIKGQTVILDIPEPNTAALLLAEKYDLSPEFETFRMYRGVAPALPLDQTFGITTFELG